MLIFENQVDAVGLMQTIATGMESVETIDDLMRSNAYLSFF
jgi:hypothetical protein